MAEDVDFFDPQEKQRKMQKVEETSARGETSLKLKSDVTELLPDFRGVLEGYQLPNIDTEKGVLLSVEAILVGYFLLGLLGVVPLV